MAGVDRHVKESIDAMKALTAREDVSTTEVTEGTEDGGTST